MKQKSGQSARADGEIENRNPNDMHGEQAEYNGGRTQTGAPYFVSVASIHPTSVLERKAISRSALLNKMLDALP